MRRNGGSGRKLAEIADCHWATKESSHFLGQQESRPFSGGVGMKTAVKTASEWTKGGGTPRCFLERLPGEVMHMIVHEVGVLSGVDVVAVAQTSRTMHNLVLGGGYERSHIRSRASVGRNVADGAWKSVRVQVAQGKVVGKLLQRTSIDVLSAMPEPSSPSFCEWEATTVALINEWHVLEGIVDDLGGTPKKRFRAEKWLRHAYALAFARSIHPATSPRVGSALLASPWRALGLDPVTHGMGCLAAWMGNLDEVAAVVGLLGDQAASVCSLFLDGRADAAFSKPITMVYLGAWAGHLQVVQFLVASGACDLNVRCWTGRDQSPLFIAAAKEQYHVASWLASLPPDSIDLDAASAQGQTPLHMASVGRGAVLVKALLESGRVDVNAVNENGETPLICAAQHDDLDVLYLLLDHQEIDVTHCGRMYGNALHAAAGRNACFALSLLLHTGRLDVNAKTEDASTPLAMAVLHGATKCVDILLGYPQVAEGVNIADERGLTPLYTAVQAGHLGIARTLLAVPGVDVLAATESGKTPFHVAAAVGHVGLLDLLLTTGSISQTTVDQALLVAILVQQTLAVGFLLEVAHADPNACFGDWGGVGLSDFRVQPALEMALSSPEAGITHLLLRTPGIDVLATTEGGSSLADVAAEHQGLSLGALICAGAEFDLFRVLALTAAHGQVPGLSFLISHFGPEVSLLVNDRVPQSKYGKSETLLTLGVRTGNASIVALLLSVPEVDINRRGGDSVFGESPIFAACKVGSPSIIRLLIEVGGCDLDVNSPCGQPGSQKTPLLACLRNHRALTALLSAPHLEYNAERGEEHPLLVACASGWLKSVELLVECPGIDLGVRAGNVSILWAAVISRHIDVVSFLLTLDAVSIDAKMGGESLLDWAQEFCDGPLAKALLRSGRVPDADAALLKDVASAYRRLYRDHMKNARKPTHLSLSPNSARTLVVRTISPSSHTFPVQDAALSLLLRSMNKQQTQ